MRSNFPRLSPISRLYPILDASTLSPEPVLRASQLEARVRAAVESGLTLLQYRNKQGGEAQIIADAQRMRSVAGSTICLILNDHVPLVEACGFDGVHLGQGDMPAAQAREILGPDRILGLSTHNPAEAASADAEPIDYLAIGPVFSTSSKANAEPVVGLEGVRLARSQTSKPLVAIGGITVARAREVLVAGADAVAVISAVFGDSPRVENPGEDSSQARFACSQDRPTAAEIKIRVAEFLQILQD